MTELPPDLRPLLALAAAVGIGVARRPAPEDLRVHLDPTAELEAVRFVANLPTAPAGLADIHPYAGPGRGQQGEAGEAGERRAEGEKAAGTLRRVAQEGYVGDEHHGFQDDDVGGRPLGRPSVHELEKGLTSVEEEQAMASASEGEDQKGRGGQLEHGRGAGAEGPMPELAGLATSDQGWGFAGPGHGPGADRDGQSTGGEAAGYLAHTPPPRILTAQDPISTFALEVDSASYAYARERLLAGSVPDPSTLRPEEFVNHFAWMGSSGLLLAGHPEGDGKAILAATVSTEGRERPPVDLVLAIDVSGSMSGPKLELAKAAALEMVGRLGEADTVRLVVTTEGVGEPGELYGARQPQLRQRIQGLESLGGSPIASTVSRGLLAAGATQQPERLLHAVLISDGWANNDGSNLYGKVHAALLEGATVTMVGVGSHYGHEQMEGLSLSGAGSAHYLGDRSQVEGFGELFEGLLVPIEDPKLQVVFEPEVVSSYRLIGYGNRGLSDGETRGDSVTGGNLGQGARAVALYELELTGRAGTVAQAHWRGDGVETPLGSVHSRERVDFDEAPPSLRVQWTAGALAEVLSRPEAHLDPQLREMPGWIDDLPEHELHALIEAAASL